MANIKEALNYKAADIKVLMLGASRVGKTSILASLSSELFRQRAIKNSNLEFEVKGDGYENIAAAQRLMEGYFSSDRPVDPAQPDGPKCTRLSKFVLNDNPGDREIDFSLLLKTKKSKGTYTIGFTDIPGEWVNRCRGGLDSGDKKTLENLVSSADVIIITVDSVLMMEENGINAKSGNKIDNVDYLMREFCKGNSGNAYKMVLFAPVKCEKYYHRHVEYVKNPKLFDEDPMELLIGQIKKQYSSLFDYLTKSDQKMFFNVAVLPVLTLGNIEFKIFKPNENAGDRSAKDMLFGYYTSKEADPTEAALIPKYDPQFCEQPLVYILLFELAKIKKLKEQRGKFWNGLDWLRRIFTRLAQDKDLLAEADNIRKNIAVLDYVSDVVWEPILITKSK